MDMMTFTEAMIEYRRGMISTEIARLNGITVEQVTAMSKILDRADEILSKIKTFEGCSDEEIATALHLTIPEVITIRNGGLYSCAGILKWILSKIQDL